MGGGCGRCWRVRRHRVCACCFCRVAQLRLVYARHAWTWLAVCLASEVVAYLGYVLTIRDMARVDDGHEMDLAVSAKTVVAGFGVFAATHPLVGRFRDRLLGFPPRRGGQARRCESCARARVPRVRSAWLCGSAGVRRSLLATRRSRRGRSDAPFARDRDPVSADELQRGRKWPVLGGRHSLPLGRHQRRTWKPRSEIPTR